jgi:monoamine oxidase
MTRIAIVGAGPGGLLTARGIARSFGEQCRVTLFEASRHIGGKLMTRSFSSVPVPYEAGAAECYDYSGVGQDPLREMVDEMGLATRPMSGHAMILDGRILNDEVDIGRHYGAATLDAIRDFRERAAALIPLEHWHPESWEWDNAHPWAARGCDELLDTVHDPVARRILTRATHSDLATEPHSTNAVNGLKNFLLDVPGYVSYYSIDGGMRRLAGALMKEVGAAEVVGASRVVAVEHTRTGAWLVRYAHGSRVRDREFDAVVLALPANQLGGIEFIGEPLRRRMAAHIGAYDRPGHYLRASLLFRTPFWKDAIGGSWFMVDAFGGACVYDESARYDAGGHGVLGFLIAGSDALAMANLEDRAIASRVLHSLPGRLRRDATVRLMEAKVHRWCAGVSAQPGGLPLRDPRESHQPDAEALPGLFAVGGYLFDSTLNGVHQSAAMVTRSA